MLTDGYIYNVTTKVEQSIANEWLLWLKEEHIPDIVKTNCFQHYRIMRLVDVDDADGPTYAVQYFAQTRADYNRYIEVYADKLRKKATDKWGDKIIAFRTLMEIVH